MRGVMGSVRSERRHREVAGKIDENGNLERRGRDDVAVDVMTIVGSVLWRGPTFPISGR